jgi:hypothetical protein
VNFEQPLPAHPTSSEVTYLRPATESVWQATADEAKATPRTGPSPGVRFSLLFSSRASSAATPPADEREHVPCF